MSVNSSLPAMKVAIVLFSAVLVAHLANGAIVVNIYKSSFAKKDSNQNMPCNIFRGPANLAKK